MKTGVSYMSHHNPRHIETELHLMRDLQLDDVLVCAQENDFVHFTGKIRFTPQIARDHGLRPIAIFWGALNLFGGGRSSQFLLEHPEGHQIDLQDSPLPAGCYVNPVCLSRIRERIDTVADLGFAGYFVDEPTPLRDDGRIDVVNRCRDEAGEWDQARGIARIVDAATNAKLEVSFVRLLGFQLFWGDYWVIGLGDDYEYAVVGTPTRKYGWILSRTPSLSAEKMERIFSLLRRQGYDPDSFVATRHAGR